MNNFKKSEELTLKEELNKQEYRLELIINRFRLLVVTILITTDYLLMLLLNKLGSFRFGEELIGLVLLYVLVYYIHYATKNKSYKWYMKYLTMLFDYFIVIGCYNEGRDIIISVTGITTHEYLLLITCLIIIINFLSALRINRTAIIVSTAIALFINISILDEFNTSTIVYFYTSLIILISGLLTMYVSRFILNFFKSSFLLKKTMSDLSDANEEINQQNQYLQEQRNQIAKQNMNITHSINYASRIQKAVFNTPEEINKVVPNNFVILKPKDIVSGDFYWFKKIIIAGNEYSIYATVDCTGHGVPGGFMSMMGFSFLNEIANGLKDGFTAAEILNKLRVMIKDNLHQNTDKKSINDGMDMTVCVANFDKQIMQYAGANNPLYVIRANTNEIIEIKADRMPVGKYIKEKESFTNHEISISTGDLFYTFSDGYIDQFGGTDMQKFNRKRFKKCLLKMCKLPMYVQKQSLVEIFNEWKNENSQLDDVCVIGVKI